MKRALVAKSETDLQSKGLMKRIGNIYQGICSIENLRLADEFARLGKTERPEIKEHDKNREANLLAIREMLLNKTYKTSEYKNFIVRETKEREISCLPYYPDRIVHYAVMIYLEGMFTAVFTRDTYSSIKKRGIHALGRAVKKSLKDTEGAIFCLKIDVKKFYPNVDHAILKSLLRRKIKDLDLLWLLDEIIDSCSGIPIGNYLSPWFANFYLAYFDHWIKEKMGVKHYVRYCDDMAIFAGSKPHLHELLANIRQYLSTELKLEVKRNYQIFPIEVRGVDIVGYVYRKKYTRLRKRNKQAFARAIAKKKPRASIESYKGMAKHANCINLVKKLLPNGTY